MRNGTFGSFVSAARDFPPLIALFAHVSSSPALVLDDSCVVNVTLHVICKGKVFVARAKNSDVESDDECNEDGVYEENSSVIMDGPTNGEDMVNMPRVDAKVMDHSQEILGGGLRLLNSMGAKGSWDFYLIFVRDERAKLYNGWMSWIGQYRGTGSRSCLDTVAREVPGPMAERLGSDRWTCDLSGDGEFKVKVIRNFIDDLFLPSSNVETRWVKFIPIKVNVFSWRAHHDRLPTRVNLSRRGVLLDSHVCPLCNAAMEDVQHVFFRCDVARVVLRKICRWWDLDWQEICSFSDWDAWFLSFRLSSRLKSILEGVFYVAWWRIWRLRNQLVFDASPPNRSTIFDDI
ncbi:RNA-directed DNA polymerase, eukaryota, partial [Tanacetum coccineum]